MVPKLGIWTTLKGHLNYMRGQKNYFSIKYIEMKQCEDCWLCCEFMDTQQINMS